MLAALALLWGASFMFIKIAVRELAPATLILGRIGSAALTLAVDRARPASARGRRCAELRGTLALARRRRARQHGAAVLAPLLGRDADRLRPRVDHPGVVPIFNAVIAFAFFREVAGDRPPARRRRRSASSASRCSSARSRTGKVLGALAVVGMALCYAIGTLLAGRYLRGHAAARRRARVDGRRDARGAPAVGIAQAPCEVPGTGDDRVGRSCSASRRTAIAFLLFFAIIAGAGADYASLVTYLVPPIALSYGAIFLGERFGVDAFGGSR